MNIVHLSPNAPFNDYWGYQDNLLPKYHAKMGHIVTIITTNTQFSNGSIVETDEADYRLNDGVRVVRRRRKHYAHPILTNLNSYIPAYELLKEIHPDFIFFHGLVSATIYDAIKYQQKVNCECIIVQDNHLDYYNSRSTADINGKLIRAFYRHRVRKTISAVERVYGVTNWRVQFAQDYFHVPSEKMDLLIMGADDEQLDLEHKDQIRKMIRERHHVAPEEFLIVTGGKIDESKKIHLLMEAVNRIKGVRLIVFGSITQDMKQQLERLQSDQTELIGWLPSEKTYEYFMAADLVCFPGTHSVMWEQACASKVPCLFASWEGIEHVNHGGNSAFIEDVSVDGIQKRIQELLFTDAYNKMKLVAESGQTDIYLYSNIAKKSLETAEAMHEHFEDTQTAKL